MNRERVIEILEAYGAQPARWPEAERQAAELFLAAEPELLADVLAEEAALDALLQPAKTAPSDLLQRRLLKALPERKPHWSQIYRAPMATAAALLVGVAIGIASGTVANTADLEAEALYADAFAGFDEDWTDWLGEET